MEFNNITLQIILFLKVAFRNWNTKIFLGSELVSPSKINKGILQGDSLSPTLFCIAMEYVSRKLNHYQIPKITINTKQETIKINHLMYIDDIKTYSHNHEDW